MRRGEVTIQVSQMSTDCKGKKSMPMSKRSEIKD
jgi:hypothetical protein